MAEPLDPHLYYEQNHSWQNFHRNISVTSKRYYDLWNLWADSSEPRTRKWQAGLAAIRQIIRDAQQLKRRVRALGGGWSLSDAAITPDFLLNTKPLNVIEIGLHPQNCDPRCATPPQRLVFAQCGATILELNLVLERSGLSLSTSGASDGQTICGAVSTGTHGAAVSFGSIQESIAGLHIVAEDGDHWWVERDSQPTVNERFCHILGAKLLRDERLFNAALVSFGSFGVIHAVLLRAEPIYLLEKHVTACDFDDVKPAMGTLDYSRLKLACPGETPYHFEVVVNLYAADRGHKGAYLRYMYKRPYQPIDPCALAGIATDPGNDIMSVLRVLTDIAPQAIPSLAGMLIGSQIQLAHGERATHGRTFGPTALLGGGLSTEIGVAQEDAPRAAEAIIGVARQFPFPGVMSLRYVAPSQALLAFTKFAPTTCAIEIPVVNSLRSREAYERIWTTLERQRIPYTFHWGQCLRSDPRRLRQAFGERLDQWLEARRKFLSPAGRRLFSNELLERCGLADEGPPRLKLLTWNIFMMPPWTLQSPKNEIRAIAIAEELLNLDYDILCLEKVWDAAAITILRDALTARYPYQYGPANATPSVHLSSGVWVLSRYPLFDYHQIEFCSSAGIESFARKGAMLMGGMVSGHRFYIVATHLQGEEGPYFTVAHQRVRDEQMSQIARELVAPYVEPNVPFFVCGDFCTPRRDPADPAQESAGYRHMLSTFGAENGPEYRITLDDNRRDNDMATDNSGRLDELDYILVHRAGTKLAAQWKRLILRHRGWEGFDGREDLSYRYAVGISIDF